METAHSSTNESAQYLNADNRHLSTTCSENMKIYTDWPLLWKRNVFPVSQQLSFNFSSHGSTALAGLGRPLWGSSITLRHITLGRTPLHEWSARRRDLNRTTRNTHKTDIHVHSGIRTRNPRMPAAANTRRRPRGHWDRLTFIYYLH